MRDDSGGEAGHGIAAISAYVLADASQLWYFERDGWCGHSDRTNGGQRGDAAQFNGAQIIYFAFCHVGCCFFDGIARAISLYKDYRVTGFAASDHQERYAMLFPGFQTFLPG